MPTTITHNNKTYEVIDTAGHLSLKEIVPFAPYFTWRITTPERTYFWGYIQPDKEQTYFEKGKCYVGGQYILNIYNRHSDDILTPFYVDSPETHAFVQKHQS